MRAVYLEGAPAGQSIGPVRIAESSWDRTRGLLGRPALQGNEGLFIACCSAVHTIGMRHTIDVVFLDRAGRIVRVVTQLRPMRMALCKQAAHVLELARGQAHALALCEGLQLSGWQTEKEPA